MSNERNLKLSRRRDLMFTVVRSAAAIAIALLVAMLLIFVSADADGVAAKFSLTVDALRQLLIGPLFKNNGAFSVKNFSDVLASMIPIMFTGLATCVMFSANQFNLGAEGGIMLGAFVSAMVAIYVPLPPVLLVSADLNEVMELSDSLIVMYGGRIAAYFEDTADLNDEIMGEYMLGLKQQTSEEIRRVCHE